jgi:two-component system alkaline phosphatase synthesis response regulator PhoP
MHILVAEDDRDIADLIAHYVQKAGWTAQVAASGDEALARARESTPDLAILDVMLPGMSGFDLCQALRRRGVDTPVIMLTARGQLVDRVVGLKIGADDYVTKPFETVELLARIEARLRRPAPVPASSPSAAGYQFGDVRIDFRRAEVERGGRLLALSAREFQLLRYFVEHRGAALSRDELLNEVWGYQAMPSTRTVDVHVAWLRQKIEANPKRPQYIQTVHGIGYRFTG